MAGKARSFIRAGERDRPPLPFGPDPPPGELDDRRTEQVLAQGDGITLRDIAFTAYRLKPDEAAVVQAVHATAHAADGIARSNGNFESVESD